MAEVFYAMLVVLGLEPSIRIDQFLLWPYSPSGAAPLRFFLFIKLFFNIHFANDSSEIEFLSQKV